MYFGGVMSDENDVSCIDLDYKSIYNIKYQSSINYNIIIRLVHTGTIQYLENTAVLLDPNTIL
jgi:hypothetical protein